MMMKMGEQHLAAYSQDPEIVQVLNFKPTGAPSNESPRSTCLHPSRTSDLDLFRSRGGQWHHGPAMALPSTVSLHGRALACAL